MWHNTVGWGLHRGVWHNTVAVGAMLARADQWANSVRSVRSVRTVLCARTVPCVRACVRACLRACVRACQTAEDAQGEPLDAPVPEAKKEDPLEKMERRLNDITEPKAPEPKPVKCKVSKKKAKNPYKVLDVDKKATKKEIKKAYFRMARACHPDKRRCAQFSTCCI